MLFGWRVRKYRTAACVTAAIRRVRWRSQKNQLINILINVHTDIIILSIIQYITFSTRSTFDFFTDMRHFIHYEYRLDYIKELNIRTYFIFI